MELDLSKILKERTNARIIWYLRESNKKYSDILKHLNERDSGRINYHLKKLISEGLVKKEHSHYALTQKGIKYSLYVDTLQLKEKYPLPVVLIAIVEKDKVLLAKRCREPCKDHWGLPGNEILCGESPIESAKNEIKSELGFDVSDENLYGSYPTIYREHGELLYHVMLFAVKAKASGIPASGKATGKIDEYRFFSRKEIAKLKIIPSNKQAILDAFSNTKKLKIQDIKV